MRGFRLLALAPMLAALTGAAPGLDQVNDSGRVLAQLDDMRAIYFTLIVVIFLMMALVVWMMRMLIGQLTKAVADLAASIDGMTSASAARTEAELLHNARIEQVMARVEAELTRRESARPPKRRRPPRPEIGDAR